MLDGVSPPGFRVRWAGPDLARLFRGDCAFSQCHFLGFWSPGSGISRNKVEHLELKFASSSFLVWELLSPLGLFYMTVCKFKFRCFGCRNETGSFICFPHVHIFHFFQLRIFSVNMCNFIFCCKLCKLGCDPDGPARIMTLNWTLASGSWCQKVLLNLFSS